MSYGLYNGCSFESVNAHRCDLGGSEFCETEIRGCTFEDCSFQASDFMETRLTRCTFSRCSFKDGEWRESTFVDCQFSECTFVYTTMALCAFESCTFDEPSSKSFVGPSKRYNVFLRTALLIDEQDYHFLEKNIGIEGDRGGTFQPEEGQDPFTVLSIRMYLRAAGAESIVGATIDAIRRLSLEESASAFTRLRYVVLATRRFVEGHKLSIASALYLSDILIATSRESTRHDVAMEVAGLVIFCRQYVLEEIKASRLEAAECEAILLPAGTSGILSCEADYDQTMAQTLVMTIERLMELDEGAIVVESVTRGSTVIALIVGVPVAAATWLKAMSYLTRKGRVVYRRAQDEFNVWREFRRTRRRPEIDDTSFAITLVTAVNTFDGTPEVQTLRFAMRHGHEAVLRFEGKAEIRLVTKD